MSVDLTISETFQGSDYPDDLLPALSGNTGMDYGPVANGSYGPLVNVAAGETLANATNNTGHLDMYIAHNGTNEITDLKIAIDQYGANSGYAYGGGGSAAVDKSNLVAEGVASTFTVGDKNNSNGTAGGLWFHMNRALAASSANKFNTITEAARIRIIGKLSGAEDGLTTGTGFTVLKEAMARDDAGNEAAATSPEDGKVGPSGNSVLGEAAHIMCRLYIRSAFNVRGGNFQWEYPFTYAFTA